MKQILDILNHVHEPTVKEWMEIAEIVKEQRIRKGKLKNDDPLLLWRDSYALSLIKRWEELTRGKWVDGLPKMQEDTGIDFTGNAILKSWQPALLTKSMFVCELQKPKPFDSFLAYGHDKGNPYAENHKKQTEAYQVAQSQVLFDGFEETVKNILVCGGFKLDFDGNTMIYSSAGIAMPKCFTLSDFITEITRYNKTASTPIEIKWTENFAKQLLA